MFQNPEKAHEDISMCAKKRNNLAQTPILEFLCFELGPYACMHAFMHAYASSRCKLQALAAHPDKGGCKEALHVVTAGSV